jgi:hypothetical protein
MKRAFILLVCLTAAGERAILRAQAVSGTILGSVRDNSGGAVSNTPVVIVGESTGLSRTATTDAGGEYTAPSLPPGTYTVSVEARGFKKTSLTGLQLGVDQKIRADIVLEIGAVTETVQVEGAAPVVQSESSELAQTVTEKQIVDLPLNGRDFVQLTRIIPGIVRGIPGANIDGAGSLAWRASASFSANGQRTRDNNFMLDGVDNNESWLNSVVVFPSVDALEEFKVQTSTYSAEFGRSSGGVVNIQVKSGTNDFHGNLFEFLRNDKFDANDFFNNKSGRAKPPFRQNQFGGTLGGRIVRDRTFFFMDYQGWRIRQAQTYQSSVPTAAMRNGDFSAIRRPIYDALSRAPFEGNRIPASRFDPAAANIFNQLYPEPNVAGQVSAATGQTINNFLYNPVLTRNDDQFDIKVDHNFSDKNHAFARYSFERTERFLPASLPHGDAGITFGAGTGLVRAQSVAINDTHTFGPRLLNEFRFGFSRFGVKVTSIDAGENLPETVGIPGVRVSDTTTAMTQITFPGREIRDLGANGNQPLLTFLDAFQYFDNVTYVAGRHTLKAGFSYTRRRRNVFNVDNIVGTYQFNQNLTSNCAGIASGCSVNSGTGFGPASFLLGYANQVTRSYMDGTIGERRPEYGAYIQDDIRLTPRLTLNAGLRYDRFVPYVEVYDRQSNFDTTTGKFVLASDSAVLNGHSVGRELQFVPKLDFAPRLGFAYDVTGTGRTVLRGGYGMFWNNPLTGTSSSKTTNPPFLRATASTTTLLPTLLLSAGLPAPPPVNPNASPTGSTRSIFDINFRDGYAQQWNLNVQQQFGKDYLWEVAYVGSKGTHLVVKNDINVAPPVVGVTNQDINRPYIRLAPALRSLSQNQSRGYSIYHAVQTKFTKRMSYGLVFINAYTFGKAIDVVSDTEGAPLNPYNFTYDRGLSDFDIKHNFTSTVNYELPFGRGKKFGSGLTGFTDKLVGGWQGNLLFLWRTGLPFTVNQQQNLLSNGTANRPNRLREGDLSNPTPDRWFDIGAFSPTTDNTGTYGNSGRNILRQPGQVNFDISVIKNTRITERIEHQFRAEFFNAFNHPQFGKPGSGPGNAVTLGAADQGVISALLFNTPMRQIQLAMKLTF